MLSSSIKNSLLSIIYDLGNEVESIKKTNLDIDFKEDSSPITKADRLINNELNKFFAKTSFKNIISEENALVSYSERSKWKYFWCIDPIDGTKEFIGRGTDYTINVALCMKDQPVFSVVYAPARKEVFVAEKGQGSKKNNLKISVNKSYSKFVNIVASKSHLNEETSLFIEAIKKNYHVNLLQYGSSLKVCKVAEGEADIYPRFGPTMEWDTCAADLILKEAGGHILNLDNQKISYNKKNLLNPNFVAIGNLKYIEDKK